MRKLVVPLALVASASVSASASAQQAAAPTPPPLTGNITLASEYRFRGIDQTFGKPAIQGGFDYTHASGIYLGNWNSNVSSGAGYPHGNIEMDFYGGYKRAFGDIGADVGFIYYAYPGTSPKIDNKEIYIGASWKFLAAKFFYAIDDYFSAPDTKGTTYLDLAANYDLGRGWGVVAHVGHLNFKHFSDGSYSDWKLGVTKDLSGWLLGAAYVGTNSKGNCSSGEFYCVPQTLPSDVSTRGSLRDAGRSTIVLSVGKTF